MAAVAPAQYETRTVSLEYSVIRCDAEATGEPKLKTGIILEKPVKIKNRAATEISQMELLGEGERKNDSPGSEASGPEVANLPEGKPQSDDITAEEEIYNNVEKSIAGKNDGSEKSFSEADSGVAEDWEGENEAVAKVGVEVANRNNCMLVFSVPAERNHLPFDLRSLWEHRFCLQGEEHDPSEEYEEYMACTVCGDNCESSTF